MDTISSSSLPSKEQPCVVETSPDRRADRSSILLLCRMSPRMNGRARALVEALEDNYEVTVVCERPPRMENTRVFRHATLLERRLAFEGKSLMHVAGALRVIQMNLLGLLYLLRIRPTVV